MRACRGCLPAVLLFLLLQLTAWSAQRGLRMRDAAVGAASAASRFFRGGDSTDCGGEGGEVARSWDAATAYWLRGLPAGAAYSAAGFERLVTDRAALRQGEPDGVTVAVIIRGGRVLVHAPVQRIHEWTRTMLAFLYEASLEYALPDTFFHVTCSDWQLQPRAGSAAPGSLVLALNAGDASWDVPMPSHSHPGEDDYVEGVAWSARVLQAHWRGTLMCESFGDDCATRCTRIQIRLAASAFPDLLDVRFTNIYEPVTPCVGDLIRGIEEAASSEVRASFAVPLSQARTKFVLAMSGTGTPSGLKKAFATGAAVLRERSQFREYFEPALIPWQHYVPFDCRSHQKDCRVLDIVRLAAASDQHDAQFQSIGAAGQRFSRRHFTRDARTCYLQTLLARLQPFFEGGRGTLPADTFQRLEHLFQPYSAYE